MLSTLELRHLLVLLADVLKCQAQMAMDKASKSCGFMKRISILEDKVSSLTAKIIHLEECDSFLVVLSSLLASCCDVSFPVTFLFCFSAAMLLAHDFYYRRYLLGLR
jgi:hypothetical protein